MYVINISSDNFIIINYKKKKSYAKYNLEFIFNLIIDITKKKSIYLFYIYEVFLTCIMKNEI